MTAFKGSLWATSLSTLDSELMGTFHSMNGGGLGKGADEGALGTAFLGVEVLFQALSRVILTLLHPLGIQKNAQALHRMLKQPLICRSSKPRLDTFQKPYVPKEKRVSISATDCS